MTAKTSGWCVRRSRIWFSLLFVCLCVPWLWAFQPLFDVPSADVVSEHNGNLGENKSSSESTNFSESSDDFLQHDASSQHDVPWDTPQPPEITDCYVQGCPAKTICQQGACVEDPCLRVSCGVGEFCRRGQCVKSCGCLVCLPHEVCWDGQCMANLCAGVQCVHGQICDTSVGQCIEDDCATVSCGPQRGCVSGTCVDDPCLGVQCLSGQSCQHGQCVGVNCPKPEVPAAENIRPESDGKSDEIVPDAMEKTPMPEAPPTEPPTDNSENPQTEGPPVGDDRAENGVIETRDGGSHESGATEQTVIEIISKLPESSSVWDVPTVQGCQCSGESSPFGALGNLLGLYLLLCLALREKRWMKEKEMECKRQNPKANPHRREGK